MNLSERPAEPDPTAPAGPGPVGSATARLRAWLTGPFAERVRGTVRRAVAALPSGRTVLRILLLAVVVVVPCLGWGVATASAEASLGPHLARYEVTVDDEVTVDLGPLGTLVIDSPLPLTLGLRVVVQEIPREVTAVEEADTLAALGADLEGYVQFFNGPEVTMRGVVQALVVDAVQRGLLAAALVGLAAWGLRSALGSARRAELAALVRPYRALGVAATVVVVVVAGTVTASGPTAATTTNDQPASAVFAGTPLEGARITGRLAGVIDTYGGYVVDAYRDNERFYDTVVTGVEGAWAERAATDAEAAARHDAVQVAGPRPAAPSASPAVSATPGGPGDGDSDETDDQAETDDEAAEPVVLLVVSDLHCNVGMARVIRSVAELSGATVVLNAGDSTINGTAVESYCVRAFADAVPDGAELVVVDGNHDSEETSAEERAVGAQVLDGEVVEVSGIRILGDSDAIATRIGVGTTLVGDETITEAGERLAEVACQDEDGVDLLLIHNPRAGDATLEQGCAPAQISGHLHRRIGPVREGEGVRYVSSSTAGAVLGAVTVGPLSGTAELTVLRFDPDSRRFIDYRLVRVSPDAQVTVGFAVAWPGERVDLSDPGGPR
ncbi:metallophosphoesterase family protein [Cellulomonas sp. KRMCY2]|uniref:metallophosphoesterase family protein n=1 Tax=Cellulomonas sp. KRMCY2 TaxID=1304865 RepID=UPI00045E670F|nr:metallophosphoesterase family protein [Cellulomonas sp. KRMCY2]